MRPAQDGSLPSLRHSLQDLCRGLQQHGKHGMKIEQLNQESSVIQRSLIKRLVVVTTLAISSSVFIASTFAQALSSTTGAAMPGDMNSGSMDMRNMMKDMNEKMSGMQPTGKTDVELPC
jgi:predicted metal-binding membrane protein